MYWGNYFFIENMNHTDVFSNYTTQLNCSIYAWIARTPFFYSPENDGDSHYVMLFPVAGPLY